MFLEKLLPATGMYCVAIPLSSGGFKHFFVPSVAQAVVTINRLSNEGHNVYIAQASFDPDKIALATNHNATHRNGERLKERSQENALFLNNFFLDIDCGEKWPLKNQMEGARALKKFIEDTGLPAPAVINSGNGLYAHWILKEPVPASQWRTIAFMLKQVVKSYAEPIGGDSSRTSDSASVLRPPGTVNRKNGGAKPVNIVRDMDPIALDTFVTALSKAAKARQLNTMVVAAPKALPINDEFFVPQEGPPSDPDRIAEKCGQMQTMKAMQGNVVEPLWYAVLGVLAYCENGAETAKHWSSGHPEYDAEKTVDKLEQWKAASGPTTCVRFAEVNPTGCHGCIHKSKIKSPIVLGRPDPKAIELQEEECPPPDGYRRGEDGLYAEEEGRWDRFYDQDLFLSRLAFDESLGYEVMTIRHQLPHEGSLECVLRSSLVTDPKALLTALADNHVKVVGLKGKKHMVNYIESYQARLQRNRRMSMLMNRMGWNEARNGQPMFVLGRTILHADGRREDASLAKCVSNADGFRTAGSLDKWVKATEIFGKPGMEPFAFALLAGGFGAPLMTYTGFAGALISMVGDSGAGKTLMLRVALSVWGYHNDLLMLKDDTKNALVTRLGVYGNLPLAVDEVTNMQGTDLSDLAYRITQGRDKARLTRNAEERKNLNTWNTIGLLSSNSSVVDRLSEAKHDASAEINRVFEYHVKAHPAFSGPVTTDLYWTIHENYGHAGEKYAAWLVQNVDKVRTALEKMREKIECSADIKGDERFWGAVVSAALLGGVLARELGLIKFDILPVMRWAANTIRDMRDSKNDLAGDPVSIIAQFLDEHAGNRLVVKGRGPATIIDAPRGALVVRIELDTNLIFFPRAAIKTWLSKRYGSYSWLKKSLVNLNILESAGRGKTLGAGTFYRGAQQQCWALKMDASKMTEAIGHIVTDIGDLEKNPAPIPDEIKTWTEG